MPIDASIPLQVQQFKPITPGELLSLKDLATRSQLNQVNLQNAQTDQEQKNNLRTVMQDPSNVDPATGRMTPSGLSKITQLNPQMGLQLSHQQEQLRLQDLAINDKKNSIIKNVGTSYVNAYDRYLQQTGGNKDQAQQLAKASALEAVDELQRNGSLKAMGFDDQAIANLRNMPDPEKARGIVIGLGGKFEGGQPASDVGKVVSDFNAGKISKKEKDEAIAKKNAPTLQMQMQGIEIAPEDKAFWADILRKGGSLPPGLARSAMGAKLVSEVMREVPKGDTKPADLIANQAELVGLKAGQRTLGSRSANIEMAVSEAQNMAPLALQASERVERTKYPTLNSFLLAAEKGTGDENVVRLGVATNSLINIYARAINPTGVATVSDKDHARELLAAAWSKGQYRAGVDQLMQELAAARKSPAQVRGDLRQAVTGKTETPTGPDIKSLLEKYK